MKNLRGAVCAEGVLSEKKLRRHFCAEGVLKA
jgi:hypothetical protein